MVIAPNTTIKFVNIPIEIDNKNQITFSNITNQLNYFNGIDNLITITGCTYQRKDGYVRVPRSFDVMQGYNYCFYQNTSHSNKWFFAFVERLEYSSTDMTFVYIKTDVWQTYQFDITFKKCFVEREHVNNDTVGLHTLPENVELGEYICNSHTKDTTMDSYTQDLCMILASSYKTILNGDGDIDPAPPRKYNGIYTGLTYYAYENTGTIDVILDLYATHEKTSAINGIFMSPKWLTGTLGTYAEVQETNAPLAFDTSTAKQTTLNGYTPVNKKLLTFPYNYLIVSNNIGQNAILHYEKFSNGTNCEFRVAGVINPRLLYYYYS